MSRRAPLTQLAFVLVLCLLVPACKNRLTKENMGKIKEGMTLAEVEKILGKGTKQEGDGSNVAGQFGVAIQSAPTVGGGEFFVWESGTRQVTIGFRQGKVATIKADGL